jgi:hypothetical protein
LLASAQACDGAEGGGRRRGKEERYDPPDICVSVNHGWISKR